MFQKVHYRLTLLCAGITIFILLIMSFLYLYVSETGLKKSQFLSFQRDMSTLIANFEQQTVITHEWLSKIENNNSYYILVIDNGIPFLFNSREKDAKRLSAEQEALAYFHDDSLETTVSVFEAYHTESLFKTASGEDYYACFSILSHSAGNVEILILSPLEHLNTQIREQRLRFVFIDITAIILLILFSYFFTKRLLLPIEQSRKEQTQFVASASHELRTPLAVILSCISACKKAPAEEKEGFLNTIWSESHRMSKLIDDMLLLSQADTCSFPLHIQPVEPDTILLNSYEAFEPMAEEKKIRLHIHLPEAPIPLCQCDGERLSQITAILLHNAISYTPENGTVTLSLSIQEEKQSGYFTVAVIDNGSGIPDEEKENIFKRFYRSDKSRSTKNHFGLGLCIAKEIITAMHGNIHVENTPGGGSTFTVRLPLLPA